MPGHFLLEYFDSLSIQNRINRLNKLNNRLNKLINRLNKLINRLKK